RQAARPPGRGRVAGGEGRRESFLRGARGGDGESRRASERSDRRLPREAALAAASAGGSVDDGAADAGRRSGGGRDPARGRDEDAGRDVDAMSVENISSRIVIKVLDNISPVNIISPVQ